MKSKVDYFPFVSGELLEQHRTDLSGKMRADLQNYLIAKSQGLVGGTSTKVNRSHAKTGASSVSSQGMYSMTDGSLNLRQDRLTKNSPIMAGQMKALHDSCYVVPEKNFRVIQDDDPAKNVAWRQALQRHEEQIAKQKGFNETVMGKHFAKIASDSAVIADETENRRQK